MKKLVLVFGALGLAITCCWLPTAFLCRDFPGPEATAPDGRYIVVVMTTACGPPTRETTSVQVSDAQLPSIVARGFPIVTPLAASIGLTTSVLYGRSVNVTSVEWRDNTRLVITYRDERERCQALNRQPQWYDVQVSYRGVCDPLGEP
jgi:hypothetical protein